MSDLIQITTNPLDVSHIVAFVSDPRAGGIDVFIGTTREEKRDDGVDLLALDYEAYDEMALKEMHALTARAREKWPIIKLAIVHRRGRVALAEASVIIAVASPHRAESFDACRFLIDSLKANVPIWKKEVWGDKSTSWVDPK
jgi:molybdopterin synthase catalytic subunit